MMKVNHEQYHKVTGAVDFKGKRASNDGMPVEGVDFDKILALLPLKVLIFMQFYSWQTRVSFIYLITIFQRCKG